MEAAAAKFLLLLHAGFISGGDLDKVVEFRTMEACEAAAKVIIELEPDAPISMRTVAGCLGKINFVEFGI